MSRFRTTIESEGFGALAKNFRRMDTKAATRVVRNSLRSGGNIIKKEADRTAPQDHGPLSRSHGARVKIYPNRGIAVAVVGPKHGFVVQVGGRKQVPANYAHLVHGGVRPHKISSRKPSGMLSINGRLVRGPVDHPGHDAEPYLKDALDRTRSKVAAKIEKSVLRSVTRELTKIGKRVKD